MTALTTSPNTASPLHSLTNEMLVKAFRALGDPLRLTVLNLLKAKELCVCDLCDLTQTTPSKLSFHLKALREAGLVTSRQTGRWVYYRLDPTLFTQIEQHLSQLRQPSAPAILCEDPPGDLS